MLYMPLSIKMCPLYIMHGPIYTVPISTTRAPICDAGPYVYHTRIAARASAAPPWEATLPPLTWAGGSAAVADPTKSPIKASVGVCARHARTHARAHARVRAHAHSRTHAHSRMHLRAHARARARACARARVRAGLLTDGWEGDGDSISTFERGYMCGDGLGLAVGDRRRGDGAGPAAVVGTVRRDRPL